MNKPATTDKIETNLQFLTRVAGEFDGTLNAATAIERVQVLIGDAQRVAAAFRVTPPEDVYGGWRPIAVDIVSYYAVGLVTCLEWHVRSRLTDLFAFAPESITDKDLGKDTGAPVLAKLVGTHASIPQYLAATRNYSTSQAYLSAFVRIFNFLGLKPDPNEIVHNLPPFADPLDDMNGRQRLDALYDERNMLVHEINSANVGHPVGHNPWTSETAVNYGNFVLQLIQSIEAVITAHAPATFPNKLLPDGSTVDIDDLLDHEIARLEAEYTAVIPGLASAFRASQAAREPRRKPFTIRT